MNWAKSRQFLVWSILGSIVVAIGAVITFTIVYKVPSCFDKVQNQDETGVDCGGSCSLVCAVETEAPVVDFVRTLSNGSSKTDVIAYIENRNRGAEARAASYTLELYDANNAVVVTRIGVLKLPVSTRPTPLFIPSAYIGSKTITHAFITFDDVIDWQKAKVFDQTMLPSVEIPTISGVDVAPKIVASIHNPQPISLLNLKVIAAVFDADGSVMAASQTLLREVPAQGDTQATFTWNEPFPKPYTKIEIIPLYP